MSDLLKKAAKGHGASMRQLYDKSKEIVYYISYLLLSDASVAANATVYAFKNAWGNIEAYNVEDEDDFEHLVIRKAVEFCKKAATKGNTSAFKLPQNRSFVLKKKDVPTDSSVSVNDVLRGFPALVRFLFILHNIADFSAQDMAKIFKFDLKTVYSALDSEVTNISRGFGLDYDDEDIYNRAVESLCAEGEMVNVPSSVDKACYSFIEEISIPFEKNRKQTLLITVGAVILAVAIAVAVLFAVRGSNKYTTGTMDGSQSTEQSIGNKGEENMYTPKALDQSLTYYADIDIKDYGKITVKLDQENAPITSANFVELAQSGFYDGLTFHRIIEGFMIQGGDPEGTGYGGSKNSIVGEFSANGYKNTISHKRGVISMARSSAYDSASSQFFIVHEDNEDSLDGLYAAFGYVTEGIEVVDAVCEAARPINGNGGIAPSEQPVINSVKIRTE